MVAIISKVEKDLNTDLLVHASPGVVWSEYVQGGYIVYQLRIVDTEVHWTGISGQPLRVFTTFYYRCAFAGKDPSTAMEELEKLEWTSRNGTRNFGMEKTQILFQITPTVEGHDINLRGGFANAPRVNLFEGIPTTCETWKHFALRINQVMARIGRTYAHHNGVKPLSMTHYPSIFFGSYNTFRKEILKHQVKLDLVYS